MSRFHPIYSTVCETFPGERNSFFFRGSVVKSTFDLVNARPRSFDDVQPDRDANTLGKPSELVKPWAHKARSFGSALVRRRGKRLESNRWAFHGWIRGSILPTDFPPRFFPRNNFVKEGFFARNLDLDCYYSYTSRLVACLLLNLKIFEDIF